MSLLYNVNLCPLEFLLGSTRMLNCWFTRMPKATDCVALGARSCDWGGRGKSVAYSAVPAI